MRKRPNLNPMKEGECFVCKKPCEKGTYCHFACAVAYSDERQRRSREIQRELDGLPSIETADELNKQEEK